MNWRSPQASLSRYLILRKGLRTHDRNLVEIRWSPRVRRWPRIAAWEGSELVLRHMVESRLLLGQAGEQLCSSSITFRLSVRSSARDSWWKTETPRAYYPSVWGRSKRRCVPNMITWGPSDRHANPSSALRLDPLDPPNSHISTAQCAPSRHEIVGGEVVTLTLLSKPGRLRKIWATWVLSKLPICGITSVGRLPC